MKNQKKIEFELEAYAPGSIIWIKCRNDEESHEMAEAIELMNLKNFIFIITGPEAKMETLSPEILRSALKMSEELELGKSGALH